MSGNPPERDGSALLVFPCSIVLLLVSSFFVSLRLTLSLSYCKEYFHGVVGSKNAPMSFLVAA